MIYNDDEKVEKKYLVDLKDLSLVFYLVVKKI